MAFVLPCSMAFGGVGDTEVNRMFWHSTTSGLNDTGAYCDNPDDEELVEEFSGILFFLHTPHSSFLLTQMVLVLSRYVEGFPQESLLNLLSSENISWGVYMEDSVSSTVFFKDQRKEAALKNYHEMSAFHRHATAGTLPQCKLNGPETHLLIHDTADLPPQTL